MQSVHDLVMCLGDFNGHVCMNMDGFNVIHRRYGVGQWDQEYHLSFAWINNYVSNTWLVQWLALWLVIHRFQVPIMLFFMFFLTFLSFFDLQPLM